MTVYLDDSINFAAFVGENESRYIASPSEFQDQVLSAFRGDVELTGQPLPWEKLGQRVMLRPGEVSIWAGINGHRKSMLTGQVMLFVCNERPAVIASLEMKPETTLRRLATQAIGVSDPTEAAVKDFLRLLEGKLWIYNQQDVVEAERIIGMTHYAAKELEVGHVVIDSLMKCGLLRDDYNRQQKFVDKLTAVAKDLNIHIHLVHHMRKGEREESVPGKFDVRGASEIVDLADNLFIVHLNKSKQSKIDRNEHVEEREPDATLTVAKQRNGEWEGRVALYFHHQSLQFVAGPHHGAIEWPYTGAGVFQYPQEIKNAV